jgi:cellobiose transport system permease protein
MQAVPRDIYESAAIDGAGAFRRFFSITIPSIRPTMIFVIVTATIGGLQIFTEPKLLNPSSSVLGGPQRQYETVVLYMWDLAFNRQNFGRATTVAWLLFIIIVGIGALNYALSRRIASAEDTRADRRNRRRQARILAQRRKADDPESVLASTGKALSDTSESTRKGGSR